MCMRFVTALLVVSFLLTGSFADEAEKPELKGQVLDGNGEPVPHIGVSYGWISEEGRWENRVGLRTDAEGNLSFKPRFSLRNRTFMALDATGDHGVIVTLDEDYAKEPLVLKLRPTTLVKAAYTCEGIDFPLEKVFVSFTARPARIAVASHRGGASFSLPLPPGDYVMTVSGSDCVRIRQRITLTEDMRVVDLGTTDLEPTFIAQHYGKELPPWNVTDARGMDPETTLADFKGKWVLLEFWGYW